MISPFTDAALEKHHVIPLGSSVYPNEKIRKAEEPLRKKREYFLNNASKSLLGLIGTFDASCEATCRQILSAGYDDIVGKVQQHIEMLVP